MRFSIILFLVVLFVATAFAQTDTTEQHLSFFMNDDLQNPLRMSENDTGLTGFQITNPVFRNTDIIRYCGNIGSAASDPLRINHSILPQYGFNQFSVYQYKPRPLSFANERTVNTRIIYARGAKKEQNFSANHYQHILKNLAAGIDYGRIFSPGLYKNQSTDVLAFDVYFVFETKNHRYGFFADYITNTVKNDENGGLVSDSVLFVTPRSNWISVPVNLNDGRSYNRQKTYLLKHQFNFLVDEIKHDSIIGSTPQLFLHHDFSYTKESYAFQVSSFDSNYFMHNYLDPLITNDSSFYGSLYNKVFLGYRNKAGSVYMTGGAEYLMNNFSNDSLSTDSTFLNITGDADFLIAKKLSLKNNVSVNLLGAPGTFLLYSRLNFKYSNTINAGVSVLLKNEQPSLISENYISNHFIWHNDFKNSILSATTFFLKYKWLQLEAGFNIYDNLISYSQIAKPVQIENTVYVSTVKLNYNFETMGWTFRGNLTVQQCNNENAFQLPLLNTYTSVFYKHSFFKNALDMQVGLDCFYNTSYFSNAFNPAAGQFYFQNETKTGNFFYVDAFVSARIKTVKLSLKCENAGGRVWGDSYFFTAHQPLFGRAFKIAIEWRFYD